MKLSQLDKLFNKEIDIIDFKNRISSELEIYVEGLKTKGSLIPINIEDDTNLNFNKDKLVQLCQYFAGGKLNSVELAYISDALLLSENVSYSEERLIGYVEQMTDPEINGQFTHSDALQLLNIFQ